MGVLQDFVKSSETVKVGDGVIRVRGLSVADVVQCFQRFPEIARVFDRQQVSIQNLLAELPDACATAIALAVGEPDEEEQAALLPLETQLDILEASFRQTFRSGFGPFAERVAKMMSGGTLAQLMTSRRPSPTSPPSGVSAEARS